MYHTLLRLHIDVNRLEEEISKTCDQHYSQKFLDQDNNNANDNNANDNNNKDNNFNYNNSNNKNTLSRSQSAYTIYIQCIPLKLVF